MHAEVCVSAWWCVAGLWGGRVSMPGPVSWHGSRGGLCVPGSRGGVGSMS